MPNQSSFDIIKILMPERYTLSNRGGDKPKSLGSKPKTQQKNNSLVSPSIPTSLWLVIVVVLLILSNVITYFVTVNIISKQSEQKIKQLQEDLANATNDPSNPNSPNSKNPGSASTSVPNDTKTKAQEAVSNNRYQDLASILNGNVTVVIGGSGSSTQSSQQAIESLNYLNGSSGNWNWNLTPEQLSQLQQGSNAQYFGNNAVIGISDNGYIVSIIVNENGQVDTIFMSPTPQDAGIQASTGEGDE